MEVEEYYKNYLKEAKEQFEKAVEEIENKFKDEKENYLENKGNLYEILSTLELRKEFLSKYSWTVPSLVNANDNSHLSYCFKCAIVTNDLCVKLIRLPENLINSMEDL
jgi:hypothetical protein